ncbi:MAG: hypothetical protein FWE02_01155 [Defluviitaleaceae bacterium]|nr:hypothetical protein [Defluviitaleaceae bacterium]
MKKFKKLITSVLIVTMVTQAIQSLLAMGNEEGFVPDEVQTSFSVKLTWD